MSDAPSESFKEEKFDRLYFNYLHKLLVYLELDSVKNEINFYEALLKIAKAKTTPFLIDQKISRMKALKRGDRNEWLSLSKELEEQDDQNKLKALFEKAKQKKD
ncbi:MAG TPA: hypothetical protein PLQ20_00750 [Candidatus Paceibacterota bacterium]|nr:hypothetical protein [Candidatus Paceibacterota bacterium]